MDKFARDLRHALRLLARAPAFTLTAVFTLALGIAANTTLFSLISPVLLKPLPYGNAERLVNLWTSYPASNGVHDVFSPPNYLDVVKQSKTIEAAAGFTESTLTLSGDVQPERVNAIRTTASFAGVLTFPLQFGRWFTEEEELSGQNVAVLSDSLWRTRFGGDRGIVGRTVTINNRAHVVIGVLRAGIGFPSTATQIYAPLQLTPESRAVRDNIFMPVIARLKPHTSLSAANAELSSIAASLARAYPDSNAGLNMGAESLQEALVGDVRTTLLVLWMAVGFMLATACANVANLLLTRAVGRLHEFAIRRSLGATNLDVVRQLLTESVLLAVAAGVVGIAVSAWALPLVGSMLPSSFPRLREINIDAPVIWFTFAVSIATGVLFGLAPAAGSARHALYEAIRFAGDRGGTGRRQRRLGRILVVGEVAVVFTVMVGAGLALRSLARLGSVDPGFTSRGLIAWQLYPADARYQQASGLRTFYRSVLDDVKAIPSVQSAALALPLPFGPVDLVLDTNFAIEGRPAPPPDRRPQANLTRVTAGYFSTMKIPVLAGRTFTENESEKTANVAIISEALARRYFAGENPLLRRILLGRKEPMSLQIVGVVADVKHNDLRSALRPELYVPLLSLPARSVGLVIRGEGDRVSALIPTIQRRVWTVDKSLAANLIAPVDELLYNSLTSARTATVLLAVFAGVTLLLGIVGMYGVLSYEVAQRRREIGIRIAIGASQKNVLRMILSEAVGLSVAGVAMGIVASIVITRAMTALLFGISPGDLPTYVAVAAAVCAAALLASYLPARRATAVDPAVSLRSE